MLGRVSQRLLTLLQLTRMALVFTAVSNGLAALALRDELAQGFEATRRDALATVAVAAGLYGFGMALNDVIDRRRDRQIAAGRPIPSGRIGVAWAVVVAAALLGVAVAGGWHFHERGPGGPAGTASLLLVLVTAGLIALYDAAGKYLVWVGLLLLGLVRFFHATVAAPELPLAWHPLFLLNHVVLVSAVAYRWEAKRPPLTRGDVTRVAGGLVAVDVGLVGALFLRRGSDFAGSLAVTPALLLPAAAAVGFAALATWIKRRANDRRAAGKTLILYGLLWLILYDALFVIGHADPLVGLALLGLWPVSYLAVRAMRVWANVTDLARRPQYVRAE